jgi:hypothetical protein
MDMKRKFLLILAFSLVLIAWGGIAWSTPVQWTDNGHWYEAIYVESGTTWDDASTAAQAAGGYLVSITSSDENNFVFSLIDDSMYWFMDPADNNEGPWIGAYYAGAAGTMNSTNWAWVNGDSFTYSSWDSGEPNSSSETVANYFSNDAYSGNPIRQAYWNNVDKSSLMQGYIIEYDTNPVPIPSAILLLTFGLAGIAPFRRKRPDKA